MSIANEIKKRLIAIIIFLGICGILVLFSDRFWLFDFLSYYVFQYFWICIALVLCFLAIRSTRWTIFAAGLCIYFGSWLAPLWISSSQEQPTSGKTLKVMQANINFENHNPSIMLKYIESFTPQMDIIVLIEVSNKWQPVINQLQEQYPYHRTKYDESPFGIALFSRYPADIQVISIGKYKSPAIIANITVTDQDQSFTVFAIHPAPPISVELRDDRDLYLNELIAHIRSTNGPIMVVGDFNFTPWSHLARSFSNTTKLVDARLGFGVLNTHSLMKWWDLIGVPIDLTYVSSAIFVAEYERGIDIESDHLPIISTITLQ